MADTIVNRVLSNTKRRVVVESTIQSDGVGSTDAILVDKSTLTGPNGAVPGRLVIEQIDYNTDGMTIVLEFDHTVDDIIATITGYSSLDFTKKGKYQGFIDPASAGATGNIIATTVAASAGDTATITLYLRKKD